MSASKQAWERVLAAVEADARRTEALLSAGVTVAEPVADAEDAAERPTGPAGVPVEWMLPTGGGGDLPPLDEMPPVPAELQERIESLRDRIDALQAELAEAMRELRQPRPRVLTAAGDTAQTPHFVDRHL